MLHHSRNPVQCSLQVGGVLLTLLDTFKYLEIAFTRDRRQYEDLDVQSGKASVVMRALQHLVAINKTIDKGKKLLQFKLIIVSILIKGKESWVITERMHSQVQASEMRFLQKIKGDTIFDKVRNSAN